MNDLYLIGNGFDLAHGLKTSYNDFLLWYLDKLAHRIFPDDHYEDELLKIDKRYNINPLKEYDTISELLMECQKNRIIIEYNHPFFQNLVENYRDYKWVDIEFEYYMALIVLYKRKENVKENRAIDFGVDDELNKLNKCFDAIKEKLLEYLFIVDEPHKEINPELNSILKETSDYDFDVKKLYLYFNYTSTIDLYINKFMVNNLDLIHIHGKLGEKNNPIIFGYGDEMDPHYGKIENLNNNEFLKNIKSFGYFRTNNYQRVISFIEGEGKEFTVKILGHSCGLSDRILLNSIFEHPNCKAIKIYYYQKSETENDYFEKTQEISRHFKATGKGDMRKKIVPFSQSVPLIPFCAIN